MRTAARLLVGLSIGCLASAATVPACASSDVEIAHLGRGINVLGYDPIWSDPSRAEFKTADFERIRRGGFSEIRVNLQAFAHMDVAGDLSHAWLDVLDGVVRHALQAGLTVVLDEHDGGPCGSDAAACRTRLIAFWRQVAWHFRFAPPTVLFEILNEPSGALTPPIWNTLLADVLAQIRRSNPARLVVIGPAGFDDAALLDALVLPERDRAIMVTVHYYAPFAFTHQGAGWTIPSRTDLTGVHWGTPADHASVARDLAAVAAWAHSHRRPILLGEFGAYDRGDMASRVAWTSAVARDAEALGFAWCYWQFEHDFVVFDSGRRMWVEPLHKALVPEASQEARSTPGPGR